MSKIPLVFGFFLITIIIKKRSVVVTIEALSMYLTVISLTETRVGEASDCFCVRQDFQNNASYCYRDIIVCNG